MEQSINKERLKAVYNADPVRFVIEIEFMELLSNPYYQEHLVKNRYFEDPKFVRYMEYLSYWEQPKYASMLSHSHCLRFRQLLLSPEYRKQLLDPQFVATTHANQFYHWKNFRYMRYTDTIKDKESAAVTQNEAKRDAQ